MEASKDDAELAKPSDSPPAISSLDVPTLDQRKRRRIARACDACRSKKIKCDGKQPCTHCTVYSYDCTYDRPSNRRRNAGPRYVEALEQRLQTMESLLSSVFPNLDVDNLDESVLHLMKKTSEVPHRTTEDATPVERMLDTQGMFHTDDSGMVEFRGTSSGLSFFGQMRKHLAEIFGEDGDADVLPEKGLYSSLSPSFGESPSDGAVEPVVPPRWRAQQLVDQCFKQASVTYRMFHRPSFDASFGRIYSKDIDSYEDEDLKFLAILNLVCAVGYLFSPAVEMDQDASANAASEGYKYFVAGKRMLDIGDCRSIPSIQAVMLMCIFLNSTANMATCYSYIGIAFRAALRLGMHRKVTLNFGPVQNEVRKRLFWTIRNTDVYISTMLGLPSACHDDYIDQDLPAAVEDDYITSRGIKKAPDNYLCSMSAVNGNTRLLSILAKVARDIYPEGAHKSANTPYTISRTKMLEIESDLSKWLQSIHPDIRPGSDKAHLYPACTLLEISYYHTQLLLYRPFIHYCRAQPENTSDERAYGYAAACINTASSVIHFVQRLFERNEMNNGYWLVLATTFTATVVLVYAAVQNPEAPATAGLVQDAESGRKQIAKVAKASVAAERTKKSLEGLFKALYQKLKASGNAPAPSVRKMGRPEKAPPVKIEPVDSDRISGNLSSIDTSSSFLRTRDLNDSESEDFQGGFADGNSFIFPEGFPFQSANPQLHEQSAMQDCSPADGLSGNTDTISERLFGALPPYFFAPTGAPAGLSEENNLDANYYRDIMGNNGGQLMGYNYSV